MLKIARLALAIQEREGWKSPLEAPETGGSRSYRNQNPGNLRKSPFQIGIKDGFAVFRDSMAGTMALHWDLIQKCTGNTTSGLSGDSTLAQLIQIWAPPADGNDTEKYIADVCAMTGLKPTDKLSSLLV